VVVVDFMGYGKIVDVAAADIVVDDKDIVQTICR
jgi:hypothetical protein